MRICLKKKVKTRHLVISFSLILLVFSGYNVYSQTAEGWHLDAGWSFIIDNNDKMFYALNERISDLTLENDRLSITHSSGAWGFQYQGSKSNITDLADAGNSFITTFNNNASVTTISNNTVYWPPDVDSPKFVNVTTGSEIQILAANFKEDPIAFNLATPPAVFIDKTSSQIIVKSNHTTEATVIEISFQENVVTGIPSIAGIGILIIALAAFFFVLIFILRRKNK